MKFELKDEYIELIKLLKLMGIADTGGVAKQLVEQEFVEVNGQIETRKRYKVRSGDIITFEDVSIEVK